MTLKYALKLIFLKCLFEFMINTAPPASNSVYGREKLFWYDKINFSNHVCHCGAVVKELLALADKPGSTPGDAVFCFFVPFFSVWSLFNTIFPFGLFFSLFLLLTLLVMHLDQYINYFKSKSGVLFWKRRVVQYRFGRQILYTNIEGTRRPQSVPTILTETVFLRNFRYVTPRWL